MSATGLEQAVAAPKDLAKSSIIPQFSGPFKPLPAETTNSASGKGISPSGFLVEITLMAADPAFPLVSSIAQSLHDFSGWILFGSNEIIFVEEFTFTKPIAFPENTFTLILPSPSGNATAPETSPAFKRTDNLGATAFPIKSWEKTIVEVPFP